MEPAAKIRRHAYFSGRVQGVGFRFTACRIAEGFDVVGYVKNLTDGRVEAVVEGPEPEVSGFLAAMQTEMSDNIRKIETEDAAASGVFGRFDVRL